MANWDEDWTVKPKFNTLNAYFTDFLGGLNQRIQAYNAYSRLGGGNGPAGSIIQPSFEKFNTVRSTALLVDDAFDFMLEYFVIPEDADIGGILRDNSLTEVTKRDKNWFYNDSVWTEAKILTEIGDSTFLRADKFTNIYDWLYQKWKMLNVMYYMPSWSNMAYPPASPQGRSITDLYRGEGVTFAAAQADYQFISTNINLGDQQVMRIQSNKGTNFSCFSVGLTDIQNAFLDIRPASSFSLDLAIKIGFNSMWQSDRWNSANLPVPFIPQESNTNDIYKVFVGDYSSTIINAGVPFSLAIDASGIYDQTTIPPEPDSYNAATISDGQESFNGTSGLIFN